MPNILTLPSPRPMAEMRDIITTACRAECSKNKLESHSIRKTVSWLRAAKILLIHYQKVTLQSFFSPISFHTNGEQRLSPLYFRQEERLPTYLQVPNPNEFQRDNHIPQPHSTSPPSPSKKDNSHRRLLSMRWLQRY